MAIKVVYEDYVEDEKYVTKFKTMAEALAYAERQYFNPACEFGAEWYSEEDNAEYLMDVYIGEFPWIKDTNDIAKIDFAEFMKNGKFGFSDGAHIVAEVRIEKK